MAWNDLAANQIPSFADLQSSPFTLNSGEYNPGTNKCVNKAEALTLYNLNASNMVGYTNNRLVPKSAYASGVTSYALNFTSASNANSDNACMFGTFGLTLYAETPYPEEGTQLYADSGLATPYVGNNLFRKYQLDDYNVYKISTAGIVTLISPCNI